MTCAHCRRDTGHALTCPDSPSMIAVHEARLSQHVGDLAVPVLREHNVAVLIANADGTVSLLPHGTYTVTIGA